MDKTDTTDTTDTAAEHRHPSVIAAELTAKLDDLPTAFLPQAVRDALALAGEFAASVAALIDQAAADKAEG